jgi:hypothetical protein
MRRTMVFLLLGPLAVALAVTLAIVSQESVYPEITWLMAAAIFIVTLPISAVVGVIDSCLARRFPVALRAGLAAASGAIVPCVLLGLHSNGAVPLSFLMPVAICGASSMWLCALLADGPGLQQPSQGFAASLQARSGG